MCYIASFIHLIDIIHHSLAFIAVIIRAKSKDSSQAPFPTVCLKRSYFKNDKTKLSNTFIRKIPEKNTYVCKSIGSNSVDDDSVPKYKTDIEH